MNKIYCCSSLALDLDVKFEVSNGLDIYSRFASQIWSCNNISEEAQKAATKNALSIASKLLTLEKTF